MLKAHLLNEEYLALALKNEGKAPERVLLPHEEIAVSSAYQQRVDSLKKIIREKVEVTGGDDWHDGAFRATDNEASIVTESVGTIAPFLGATVVSYPEPSETRVTLGSRATITQNKATFPVDLVGFRAGYPLDIIDEASQEEVTGISVDSPLGQAILGKRLGEEASYENGERTLHVVICGVSQTAIQGYFASQSASVVPEGPNN